MVPSICMILPLGPYVYEQCPFWAIWSPRETGNTPESPGSSGDPSGGGAHQWGPCAPDFPMAPLSSPSS